MLLENLYQKGQLPQNVNPNKVKQILVLLIGRLSMELAKTHVWLAVCTVAVEAGCWRGRRLAKRRIKLLALINVCAKELDMPPLDEELPEMFKKGWEQHNLYYGYGGIYGYADDNNCTVQDVLLVQYAEAVRDSVVAANRNVNPEDN